MPSYAIVVNYTTVYKTIQGFELGKSPSVLSAQYTPTHKEYIYIYITFLSNTQLLKRKQAVDISPATYNTVPDRHTCRCTIARHVYYILQFSSVYSSM